jgi:hypothetical protein
VGRCAEDAGRVAELGVEDGSASRRFQPGTPWTVLTEWTESRAGPGAGRRG